jgi:nucleoside-diphosphate-sugar epimerase
MALHVIVGAGPVGTAAAESLVLAGHRVRMVTRRGTGPSHPEIELIAADATDATRLAALASGAAALYNCANPPYHRWPTDWPPLAAALLQAAQASAAALVSMSNLYGYGPVEGPLTEELPLAATTVKGRVRAAMWQEALAAHRAGRIRATEGRASDFIGPGAHSLVTDMVLSPVRRGKAASVPANLDVPHSLTYTVDAGRTLAALGQQERAWGRAWHVPTAGAQTLREVARRYASIVDRPAPRLRRMPALVLRTGGLFSPTAREFLEMRYQFERPFVLDSSAAQRELGLNPTSLDDALRSMA